MHEGKVPESRIDDAARRILLVKARMHLFDHPLSDPALTSAVGSAEHRQVARECVQKSLVLLKNEAEHAAALEACQAAGLAGQAADDLGIQCGGWTITWQGKTGNVTQRRHNDPGRHPASGRARHRGDATPPTAQFPRGLTR